MRQAKQTGGRRAGGGLAERLAQIKKRDPTNWTNTTLRRDYFRWMSRLLDAPDVAARFNDIASAEAQLVAVNADGRVVAMAPWIWRELATDPTGARFPANFQTTSLTTLLHSVRDWALATRPNLYDFTLPQAVAAADDWHANLEAKDNATALRKLVHPNYTTVLDTPYGTWRRFTGQLTGFMSVGKMLGHCYQHEHNARSYGERQTTYNLFGKDGRPVGALTVAGREVTETKGVQNEHVLPDSALGKADVLLVKHLFPEDWHTDHAVWGEGARHLMPISELTDKVILNVLAAMDWADFEAMDLPDSPRLRALAGTMLWDLDEMSREMRDIGRGRQHRGVSLDITASALDTSTVTYTRHNYADIEMDLQTYALHCALQDIDFNDLPDGREVDAARAEDAIQATSWDFLQHNGPSTHTDGTWTIEVDFTDDVFTVTARLSALELLQRKVPYAKWPSINFLIDKVEAQLNYWLNTDEHLAIAYDKAAQAAVEWGKLKFIEQDDAAAARFYDKVLAQNAAKDKPKGQTNRRPRKGRRDTRPQPLLLGRSAKPCNTPPGWNHVGKDCARYVRSDIRGNIHDVTRKHAADCWCYRCVRANEVQARDHDGPFRSATTAMNYAHRREQHLIKSPAVEGQLNKRSARPRGRRAPLTNPQWAPKYVLCVEVWTLQDGKTTGTRVARLETFAGADEGQTAARQAARGLNPQFAIKVSHLGQTGASHAIRVVLRELDTDKLVPQGLLEPLAFAPDKMPMLLGAQSIAEAFGRMEGVNLKKPLRSRA